MFVSLAVVFAAFLVGTTPSAYAATDIGAAAQGLQVSPAITNLNAVKGNTYLVKVSILNVTAHSLQVTGTVGDFGAKDETGTPKILTAEQDSDLGSSASFRAWTGTIGGITLAAKTSQMVTIPVTVPDTAEAGGHYGIITFTGAQPNINGQEIGQVASIGSLVLVRVAGQITEQLKLDSFYVTHNGRQTGFVQNGPLDIVTRFQNTGNVHVAPTGIITVKNMLGGTTASLALTNKPGNILPDSIRRFDQTLKNKWLFGKYSLTLNATYGESGKSIVASTSFWAIPYKLIAVVVVALALLIVVLRKGLKRYNQRVIEKHTGQK